jgi:hypothetical protein
LKSTVKLLGCFAFFTLLHTGLGVLFGELFGVVPGVLAAVAGPVSEYFTVRFSERLKRLGGAPAGYRAATRRGLLGLAPWGFRGGAVFANQLTWSNGRAARNSGAAELVSATSALR